MLRDTEFAILPCLTPPPRPAAMSCLTRHKGVRFRLWTFAFLLNLGFAMTLRSGSPSPPEGEFFEKEIRPLLAERCFKCHGGEKTKAGLRLTSRASILSGGDSGPAGVPGTPEQ